MSRQTAMEKYLAAVTDSGLTVSVTPSRRASWYGHKGEMAVYVMNFEKAANMVAEFLAAETSYRVPQVTSGYEVFFSAEGKYLGTNALHISGNFFRNNDETREEAKARTTYYVGRDSGSRRAEYLHRGSLAEAIERVTAISPVKIAERAAEAERKAAERVANEEAKVARILAIKPDVRNAVWRTNNAREQALADTKSELKALINTATEALTRLEQNDGYVYDSDFHHLATILSHARANAAKVSVLNEVINSDFAPLFDGSPWAD